jgi:hypothetical protein
VNTASNSQISAIIPTLNEPGELPETLRRLRQVSEVTEILVSDGGSTDATEELARQADARFLTGPPGRGGQLRRGAQLATGDVLLFLHADTWLPENAGAAIADSLANPAVVGGAFRKAFRDPHWLGVDNGSTVTKAAVFDAEGHEIAVAARRAAVASRIDSGVVIAFGGRALVHDFSTFYQLPAFRYLTELNEPDAALVMVVRNQRPQSTLFLTALDARTAFYYGQRVDSATSMATHGLPARSSSALPAVLDSLAATGLPFFHIPDVETMDFARNDTLTRGQEALKALAKRFPTLSVRNGMPLVLQARAKKSDAELALIRQAAEISAEGHRAAMLTANPTREYELGAALEY